MKAPIPTAPKPSIISVSLDPHLKRCQRRKELQFVLIVKKSSDVADTSSAHNAIASKAGLTENPEVITSPVFLTPIEVCRPM
ncbi:hypothetical protein N7460_010554 [Penicillium canescens]|uniref:Uncharacterized protein n=1 Tax=Penicillium canescens TaxID=5083 RepID=A0AAD6I576_PENCN|nr:hypothetical protein N7460_010554 [Penicillium canescens]KAJ6060663.1 hypothetical protein N7444_002517 [Penicillium canescens]